LRTLWTGPTTLVGHAFARFAGCAAPERIGGSAAPAFLYRLPVGRLRGLGAIAIGHAIVVEPSFAAPRAPWIFAHELSHTRQHDWLGPAYLFVHAAFQLASAAIALFRPVDGYPPQHAYNVLERRLLCVPFDVLVDGPPASPFAKQVLRAFALGHEPVSG
jgi:hypothetical protein